jgi:hypothetical protein
MATPSLLLIPDRYKAAKLYSQIPDSGAGDLTFARNSNATRVNSAGLIEKVRTNIILQSETFDNATWLKINANVTANSTTAPNGTLTADTLEAPLAISTAAYQAISSEGGMTFSVYAKANTSNFIYLSIFDVSPPVDYAAIFDLSNGTFVGNGGLASVDSYSIENAGNGWYRLSVTKDLGAVGSHNYILGVAKTGNSVVPVAGTSVFVWGCQLEVSDFGATDYIPTTTAAVSVGITADIPRLDYTGGGCPSLLLEPQRANLQTFSEQFDNADWGKTNATITANNTASPDGYTNADKVIATTTNGVHRIEQDRATAAQVATQSVFAKASGYNFIALENGGELAYFNISTGVVGTLSGGTASIQNYGNGWYRCIFTATGLNTKSYIYIASADNTLSFAGDDTSGAFLWGAQLEAGSYVSSYIPSLGSSVTRLADAASKTGISSLIGQTEGTLFIDVVPTDLSSLARYISIEASAGVGSGWIGIFGDTGNVFRFYGDGWDFNAGSIVPGTRYKVAIAYKNGVLTSAYINGVSVGTLTANTTSKSYATLKLANAAIGNFGCSDFFSSAIFPIALSNSELAILTAL